MKTPDHVTGWHKSSRSGNNSNGNCVEVALVYGEGTGKAK